MRAPTQPASQWPIRCPPPRPPCAAGSPRRALPQRRVPALLRALPLLALAGATACLVDPDALVDEADLRLTVQRTPTDADTLFR